MTIITALMILLITIVISWFSVGRLRSYLIKQDILDTPNDRTMHQGSIPRGGGIVIIALVTFALLVLMAVSNRPYLFLGLIITCLLWATLSWWDDKRDLSPKLRLGLQLVFGALGVSAFGWVTIIQLSTNWYIELAWLGGVISFIGVIWLANLYNFMDGIDGLMASQTIIASITLSFWFYSFDDLELAALCLVISGASYGFLLWNWRPAKIFMGDVGSITLGALFASLIIIANTRYAVPVISLVMLFAMVVVDASLTILKRIIKREKFWLPHRQHYYQRLGLAGMAHDKIVLWAILIMLFCSLIATLSLIYRDTILLFIGVVGLLAYFSVMLVKRYEQRTLNAAGRTD